MLDVALVDQELLGLVTQDLHFSFFNLLAVVQLRRGARPERHTSSICLSRSLKSAISVRFGDFK